MPSKRSKLKYSDGARNDLDETWAYIAERAPEYADRVINELHDVSLLIAQNPRIGTVRDYLMPGMCVFPHDRYNIYYLISDEGIEIYRVLHGSRDAVQVFDENPDQPN